uniref:PX domain-containing protein n=1 Tax=Lotharella globosa TaxID=91324 RepID=A0A7S3YV89_9EUKA|mmetsp:Transcript_27966/g.54509  ORF Transcript_27966/g.54509 Transcript_27966/m.54509 type:complete len:478 (+) Transcript_27966:61-1494(+)
MSEAIEYNANDIPSQEDAEAQAAAEAAAASAAADAVAESVSATIAEAEAAVIGGNTDERISESKHETPVTDEETKESKGDVPTANAFAEKGTLEAFYMSIDSLQSTTAIQKGHHTNAVEIGDPQSVKSFSGSYTTYALTIEPRIEEVKFVRRRYSDFIWLRKWLGEAFPCIFIPPLPPKNFLAKMKSEFIEERQKGLQEFMKRVISRHPFFIHSTPFQLFISKHSNTFDRKKKDVEKAISGQTDASVASMFNSIFPRISKMEMPKEPEERVLRLKDYLTNSSKQVSALLDSSSLISTKWIDIVSHSDKVTGALKSLNKVENGYAQRPEPPRMDVVGKFESWADVIKGKPTQWSSIVVEIFKQEKLDIGAMLEVVKKWEAINKRLVKQRERVAKYNKGDGAELSDKQKAAKEKDEENLRDVVALHEICTKIMFQSEVLHYWDQKTRNFNSQVHAFFKSQLDIASKLAQVWAESKEQEA